MSIRGSVGAVLALHCFGITDAVAQIVTDGTMGPAATLNGPNFQIGNALGTQLGSNLFHSFTDFNVQLNQSATFTSNFAGVTSNVISRVTGGNASVINGLLSSEIAGADFWFINPNGLVFGANAVLDVPAGFHASTADVLELGPGGSFRATNPAASSLTVASPSAFGFLDATVGAITVTGSDLTVVDGAELSLVGGAIQLQGASLEALSGRVDLMAVASPSEVSVDAAAGTAPDITGVNSFNTVLLDNQSFINAGTTGAGTAGTVAIVGSIVDVRGNNSTVSASTTGTGDAGSIVVEAQQLLLRDGGFLVAESTSAAADAGASGELTIDAPVIRMSIGGRMSVDTTGGAGGRILINTNDLSLSDFADTHIRADTHGNGHGGDIVVRGLGSTDDNVTAASRVTVELGSTIHSDSTASGAQAGQAGTITIHSDVVSLRMGGFLSVSTVDGAGTDGLGGAVGGAIDLHTNFLVTEENGFLFADSTGAGQGGQISVQAFNAAAPFTIISDDDGAIKTSTSGTGDAGSIVLGSADAPLDLLRLGQPDLTFDDARGLFSESTAVGTDAGAAGTITVFADRVDIQRSQLSVATVDGSRLDSSGSPVGGSITLNVGTLQLGIFGAISAATSGAGPGGSITILANDPDPGDTRPAIEIFDGFITTSASGSGDAGQITLGSVDAPIDFLWMHDFEFDAPNHETNQVPHGLFSDSTGAGPEAGAGGEITVYADEVQIRDGGRVSASTVDGDGGAIEMHVDDMELIGSAITAGTGGTGDAGNITLSGLAGAMNTLTVTRRSFPSSVLEDSGLFSGSGAVGPDAGAAGSITVQALDIDVSGSGNIEVTTNDGAGGAIDLQVDRLRIRDFAVIGAGTLGQGDGGEILVRGMSAPAAALIDISGGNRAGFSTSSGFEDLDPNLPGGQGGDAGDISITASELRISSDLILSAGITASTGDGAGGSIVLAVDSLTMNGGLIFAATGGEGDAGTISITGTDGGPADLIEISELNSQRSIISTQSSETANDAGNAGSIEIVAREMIVEGGEISSNTFGAGDGGSIHIEVDNLSLLGLESTINVGTSEPVDCECFAGSGGNIAIEANDRVLIDSGSLVAESTGTGASGSISVSANELQLLNGGALSVRSTGSGSAGSVFTDIGSLFMSGNSQIDATATSSLAGNVELNVSEITFLQDSLISGLSADPDSDGGNFIIQQPQALVLQRSSILANSGSGGGGNISITADAIVIDVDSTVEATGEVLAVGEVLGSVLQLDPPIVVDAAAALDTSCASQQAEERSSMIVRSTPPGAVREPYLPTDAAVAAPSCRP